MVVDILGTQYDIFRDVPECEMPPNSDGYCDPSAKQIYVVKGSSDPHALRNLGEYLKSVTRHEIIHAFLYESGLWASSMKTDEWALNEEMVDWISIQSPKIFKAFREANCL